MAELTFIVKFVLEECCNCHAQFAMTEQLNREKRNDHTLFYCPRGHGQQYTAMSDAEKIRREKVEVENRLQARINEETHLRLVAEKALKSETTKRRKIEKRVAKGVCPCCNRTFEDLARHMSGKHKDFALPPGHQKQITQAVQ